MRRKRERCMARGSVPNCPRKIQRRILQSLAEIQFRSVEAPTSTTTAGQHTLDKLLNILAIQSAVRVHVRRAEFAPIERR
jgi:hypothetical protein